MTQKIGVFLIAFGITGMCLLGACTQPQQVDQGTQDSVLSKIIYKRDRFGNCLALIESNSSNGFGIISITNVPNGCDKP